MDIVQSPCRRNCCLNAKNICLGCFRSLPEIMSWQHSNDQQRLLILQAAKNRQQEHPEYPSVT